MAYGPEKFGNGSFRDEMASLANDFLEESGSPTRFDSSLRAVYDYSDLAPEELLEEAASRFLIGDDEEIRDRRRSAFAALGERLSENPEIGEEIRGSLGHYRMRWVEYAAAPLFGSAQTLTEAREVIQMLNELPVARAPSVDTPEEISPQQAEIDSYIKTWEGKREIVFDPTNRIDSETIDEMLNFLREQREFF